MSELAAKWNKLREANAQWRIDESGHYLLHKLVSAKGERLGYALLRLEHAGIFDTPDEALLAARMDRHRRLEAQ
jgi:hypothetical protein